MQQATWMKRYRQRFADIALSEDGKPLTKKGLDAVVNTAPFDELSSHYEEDPEGAADEEMSNWAD